MRLFVAVDVPTDLKDHLEAEVVEVLRPRLPGARFTRPEGRHLTLKFLGQVPDDRVGEIASALREAAARHVSFEAAFDRIGGFPNLRRPRVLWVGIGPGAEPMARLAADVDRALAALGFEAEQRPFHAHLTLARFKTPRPVGDLPPLEVPDEGFAVDEVVLFRSDLHPKGARYTALERLPLR
jgi:RNA 2',3'-cyclic 3'-phosphodiesterase